jgi:hypothetical protein
MAMAQPRSRREALLTDPKLRSSIRTTLRSRDVSKHALEDLTNETIERALASRTLPEDDDGAARTGDEDATVQELRRGAESHLPPPVEHTPEDKGTRRR